jgi:hypothetical protein
MRGDQFHSDRPFAARLNSLVFGVITSLAVFVGLLLMLAALPRWTASARDRSIIFGMPGGRCNGYD